MEFLAPFGLLFALFLPAVIILYILKLRRIKTTISSTLLWKQSLEDLRANAPFQKLKNNLLMILQLIAVAILTLAIARPVLELGGLQGQSYIVLIDQSASMNAVDEPPSRLEKAKEKAIQLVNDMSMGDQMMVVAFSSNAHVLNTFQQDKGALRQTIHSIQPTDNPTRIQDAVMIALSSADLPRLEVFIFSDGGFEIPEDSPLAALKVNYVPVGRSAENVGIVDLMIREDFEVQSKTQVLAGVQNTGQTAQEVYLELYGIRDEIADATTASNGDGQNRQLLNAYKLSLEAGQRETVIVNDPGSNASILELKLDSNDNLAVDNTSWAVVPNNNTINVLLVTEGNFYLQRALNLDSRVQLATTLPANYTNPEDFDIVVFDAFSPLQLVNGNYLFINSVPNLPDWSMGDMIEFPGIVDWNRFHTLNKYLSYENLEINQAKNMAVPEWVEVVLESSRTPLIVSFSQQKMRGIVIGFDIYDTSWPLRVSYPIFFSNMLDWFMKEEQNSLASIKTGEILTLPPPDVLESNYELSGPDGYTREIVFNENAPQYISDIAKTGIYEYNVNGESKQKYAFNLASSIESDITPITSLVFGTTEVQGNDEAINQNQEIWRYLVIAALIVVIIEWLIFTKRAKYSI